MAEHVCPVWIGYLLASPIRKLWQNPKKILKPYIRENMTVLDVGSAMGYFSLPMAKMVKPSGKVICADLQEKMIEVLTEKARKAGLLDNIETVVCSANSLNMENYRKKIDFALAFAVLHEVPDQNKFLTEIFETLKPGGRLLLSEPSGHVKEAEFEQSLSMAGENHFKIIERPKIKKNISAVLEKPFI